MGGGRFTVESYRNLKINKGYDDKSREQIFTSTRIPEDMDPKQVKVRESRDSEEHPESLSIIVGLDVTGSMGMVPEDLVKNTLPDLVGSIIEAGVEHPQVCFIALGDYIYDSAPLQIGQFESSAELLDRWLTRVYLEGGGGGNGAESYNLAYLFAARHTSIDCWEKRKQKGFLVTIGDEPCHDKIPSEIISRLSPEENPESVSTAGILQEAQERYNVYHLHIEHDDFSVKDVRKEGWKELLGQNFLVLSDYTQIAKKIASIVIEESKKSSGDKSGDIQVEDML